MSNKINIDKMGSFNPVRAAGQNEVKKSDDALIKPIEVTKINSEDKLEFSNRGTEVGKLIEDVKSLPETRQDKIAALRDQIATGQYDPSSADIADAILKDEKF